MYQINHYDMKINLTPNRRQLSADVHFRLTSTYNDLKTIEFYLYEEFEIDKMSCQEQDINWERNKNVYHPMKYTGTLVKLTLNKPLSNNEEINIQITYRGKMSRIVWGYCMITPQLVELRDFACWYPYSGYQVNGFTYQMELLIPTNYTCIMNAELEHDLKWKTTHLTTDINLIASSQFRKITSSTQYCNGNIYYVYLSDKQANILLKQSLEVVRYFSEMIGKNEKVQNLTWVYSPRIAEGGYAYGNLATMSEMMYIYLFNHPEMRKNFSAFYGNCHEIGHFWWREQVSVDRTTYHDWLMEGLTEYISSEADRVLGKRNVDIELFSRYEKRVNSIKEPVSMVDTSFNHPNRYTMWYEKGSFIIRMLGQVIGKARLNEVLRLFYQRYKGKQVLTDEFIRCAEEVYKESLTWFFKQWLEQKEIPSLQTTYSNGILTIIQMTDSLFKFPLEIVNHEGENKNSQKLWVKNRTHDVKVDSSNITIDPHYNVLFDLKTNRRIGR